MATFSLQAGAPNLPLGPGMKLVLEAIDPSTGDAVDGVTCSRWSIYGRDESDEPATPQDQLGLPSIPLLPISEA